MFDLDFLAGPAAAWAALAAAIAALLAVDLAALRGRGGTMTTRSAAVTSAVWIAISLAFCGVVAIVGSGAQAQAFLAGYAVEKSLSLDNVFVFLIVFNAFAIASDRRAELLTYGILAALALRLLFILGGAAALHQASWIALPFAALLAWTGWRLWRGRHDHGGETKLVDGLRGKLRVAEGDHGGRFTTRVNGRRALTAAGATLLVIAVVDILFAVDSVPAILAITTDTFIVFAANAFALLGLRPLFFLVAGLVERLYYLKAALAVLLMFIAAKLAASELIGKVGPLTSLAGVVAILGAGVVASLVRARRLERAQAGDRLEVTKHQGRGRQMRSASPARPLEQTLLSAAEPPSAAAAEHAAEAAVFVRRRRAARRPGARPAPRT